jgi:hypothetical protein
MGKGKRMLEIKVRLTAGEDGEKIARSIGVCLNGLGRRIHFAANDVEQTLLLLSFSKWHPRRLEFAQ